MTIRRCGWKSAVGAIALFLVALTHNAGDALAQDKKKIRVALSWIPDVQYAGLWLAMERGYFAEEGLEIEVLPGGPNAPASAVSVAAGKADIGSTTWFPYLDAVSKGNQFKLLAVTFQISPLGVISLAQKPILGAKDLVGSKILAQGPAERAALDATLALAGIAGSYTFIPAGFSPEPLLAKQADGYTGFRTSQAITLEHMGLQPGKDFHFTSFDAMGFKTFASGIFTSSKFLESNRADVVKFLRALVRGWNDNYADPAIAAKLTVEKYGADFGHNLKQQTRMNELDIDFMKSEAGLPILSIDRKRISGPGYEAARATGRKDLPEFDSIADLQIMDEVHASLKGKK